MVKTAKRAIIQTILLILLVLMLSSCQSGANQRIVERDFHTGTQGLEMRFLPSAPPSRVYEGDGVDIIVEVKNRGAYPISSAFLGHL